MKDKDQENHTALYRKYRPHKFKDVLGQDHVVDALKGSIKNDAISHAYLFAGSRGTGKTSIARIFADEIGTKEHDLYEIDAASNRGIDDIREIRDSVSTLPYESKYKVYIVDEVHMLTKEAFNALLKTLEEPPSHAVFILATTEVHKLPDTVISRCQHFTFKKPGQKLLKSLILKNAKEEEFELEPAGADLIALLGEGSFRDAQGVLQKVISGIQGKKITASDVEKITGIPASTLVNNIIISLTEKDLEKGLKAIRSASENDIDMKIYLKLILKKLRALLMLRFVPNEVNMLSDFSEEDAELFKELSQRKDLNINSGTLLEFLNAYDNVGKSYLPELPLELALIKLLGQDK
ncbi:MAG: DNA polymerase III subunit gamma/tau [Candidatus Paceibacterota bacterium]